MNPKSKRAIRRWHRERLRKRRLRDLTWLAEVDADRVNQYIDTPTPCSCFMCGYDRKWFGPTVQERRQVNYDPITREWDTPEEDEAWKYLAQAIQNTMDRDRELDLMPIRLLQQMIDEE